MLKPQTASAQQILQQQNTHLHTPNHTKNKSQKIINAFSGKKSISPSDLGNNRYASESPFIDHEHHINKERMLPPVYQNNYQYINSHNNSHSHIQSNTNNSQLNMANKLQPQINGRNNGSNNSANLSSMHSTLQQQHHISNLKQNTQSMMNSSSLTQNSKNNGMDSEFKEAKKKAQVINILKKIASKPHKDTTNKNNANNSEFFENTLASEIHINNNFQMTMDLRRKQQPSTAETPEVQRIHDYNINNDNNNAYDEEMLIGGGRNSGFANNINNSHNNQNVQLKTPLYNNNLTNAMTPQHNKSNSTTIQTAGDGLTTTTNQLLFHAVPSPVMNRRVKMTTYQQQIASNCGVDNSGLEGGGGRSHSQKQSCNNLQQSMIMIQKQQQQNQQQHKQHHNSSFTNNNNYCTVNTSNIIINNNQNKQQQSSNGSNMSSTVTFENPLQLMHPQSEYYYQSQSQSCSKTHSHANYQYRERQSSPIIQDNKYNQSPYPNNTNNITNKSTIENDMQLKGGVQLINNQQQQKIITQQQQISSTIINNNQFENTNKKLQKPPIIQQQQQLTINNNISSQHPLLITTKVHQQQQQSNTIEMETAQQQQLHNFSTPQHSKQQQLIMNLNNNSTSNINNINNSTSKIQNNSNLSSSLIKKYRQQQQQKKQQQQTLHDDNEDDAEEEDDNQYQLLPTVTTVDHMRNNNNKISIIKSNTHKKLKPHTTANSKQSSSNQVVDNSLNHNQFHHHYYPRDESADNNNSSTINNQRLNESSQASTIIVNHSKNLKKQMIKNAKMFQQQQQIGNNTNVCKSRQINNIRNQTFDLNPHLHSANNTMIENDNIGSSPNLKLKKAINHGNGGQFYHKRSETATEFISQNNLTQQQQQLIRNENNGQQQQQMLYRANRNQASNLEETPSVKSILKKIALQNNSTQQQILTATTINQSPPLNKTKASATNTYHHQKSISNDNNQYQSKAIKVNNKGLNKIVELMPLSTQNSTQNKQFLTKQQTQASIVSSEIVNHRNNRNEGNSLVSSQYPLTQDVNYNAEDRLGRQTPTSFMIAKQTIQNNSSATSNDQQQLAYMTLKTIKSKQLSNQSSTQNITSSMMTSQAAFQKQGSILSSTANNQYILQQKDKSIQLPRQDSLNYQATPNHKNKHSKIMNTVLPTFARQSPDQSALKRKESFQKNLQNHIYFQEDTPVSDDTPSFQKKLNHYNQSSSIKNSNSENNSSSVQGGGSTGKNRQRTLDNDLMIMMRGKNNGSQLQNQQHANTAQNTFDGSLGGDSTKNSKNQKNQAVYYKMIKKIIKQPTHYRNQTMQVDQNFQMKASTFNDTLNSDQIQQYSKGFNMQNLQRQESPQQTFTISPQHIRISSQGSDHMLNDQQPHFQILPTSMKSQNSNHEDESPFMNDNRKNNKRPENNHQKQQCEDNSYSPTKENNGRKKSIVQSYQTQPIINQITPQYDKKGQQNQLQSVLQINQFKQSIDNKSTEMSSKQDQISRFNSGQNIPVINSVGSSQIKSTVSLHNQNFSSMSGTNYQQLLQKMINIRDSNSGKSPQDTNSMKQSVSSKGLKCSTNAGKKATSLIKEDSNEEKSSSNSNSNQEIIIDPKVKPIQKDEIFTKKLRVILSGKHRRQKTAQLQQVFGKLQNSFYEKRYHEDDNNLQQELNQSEGYNVQKQQKEKNGGSSHNESQESLRTMIVLSERDLEEQNTKKGGLKTNNLSEILISEASQAFKHLKTQNNNQQPTIDKTKHWLLDSSRFDFNQANLAEDTQQAQSSQLHKLKNFDDDLSDTVEFDRDNSSQETPPHISTKGKTIHQENIIYPRKQSDIVFSPSPNRNFLKQSHQSPTLRLSRQIVQTYFNTAHKNNKNQDLSNVITIDQQQQQDEESCCELNNQSSNLSLIVDQLFNIKDTNSQQARQHQIQEIHNILNVDIQEKVLLYPKLKLPTLDNFLQPSYYDTIYLQQFGLNKNDQPQLESQFDFDS